ncbi:MAG TPA: ATP-binding cassette domain-containing protein [Ktedonobacterales bacterium]
MTSSDAQRLLDILPTHPDRADAVITGVTYTYPLADRPALSDVSLRIAQGEYVALLGHNGSGKSTLARIIGGLIAPDSGSVSVADLNVALPETRGRIRGLIGMIFSDPDNQIVATVVEDDVAWSMAARGLPLPEIRARATLALAAVGLADAGGRAPWELSGGQRQRLTIAGALALEPRMLIADEPTAMLDPLARREVAGLLLRLNRERGLTVIHVTHALDEAVQAGRVVILEEGRIALDAPPAEAFASLDRLQALRLVVPDTARLGEVLRARGLAIPRDALAPESLVSALERERAARG